VISVKNSPFKKLIL